MFNKNDIIELDITDITDEGNGVGRNDGIAVFVPFSAVGDKLSVKIVKTQKTYAYGIIDKIIVPSEDRIESNCPVFKKCGGCSLRHISYKSELSVKDNMVRNAFKRIGGIEPIFEEILGCDETDYYRNKAQYPVSKIDGKAVFGFYAQRSHRVIPFADCRLQPEIFAEISKKVLEIAVKKGISPYDETTNTGLLRHIFLRRGYHSGEIMLCLVVRKNCKREIKSLANDIVPLYPEIKTVVMNINPDKTNVIMGKETEAIYGDGFIYDEMCGNKIKLAPEAFYQVNTKQAERLYEIASEYADLKGDETLLDLYCGAGTIGLSMAKRVKKLIGVEIIPEAIENAKENAIRNNIDNAEFICGDAGKVASELIGKGIRPDVIVLDPARKGCDDVALDAIIKMNPQKIVYISCNPATCARDLKILSENGYKTEKARAVDMFPRTNHCECVVKLTK